MAGLPLKSGADFYNLEASRMRLHNLGADPTEVGAGLIYFNTSTGLNTSKKARLYTGSEWKTIAFSEDLDVVSNADFLTLKDRVDLLIGGDVDTDAIINNMKEVSAFLAGFAEDASLMDALNGKLDKTGGILTSASTPLTINRKDGNSIILYQVNGGAVGVLGFNVDGDLIVSPNRTTNSAYYNVLHAGNVGEYKAGNSDKLEGQTLFWVQNNGLKFSRVKVATSSNIADANADLAGGGMIYNYSQLGKNAITNCPSDMQYGHIWQVGSYGNDVLDAQLAWDINHSSTEDVTRKLWWRARDSINGWTYAKWHQIAFTDSDITGSVLNSDGDLLLTYNDGLLLGYGSAAKSKNTTIYGNSVVMRYGSNRTQGFILNSSGDVTISNNATIGGTVTIDGKTIFLYEDSTHAQRLTATIANNIARIYSTGTSTSLYLGEYNGNAISIVSNNVGIGTTNPQYKLDVKGKALISGELASSSWVSDTAQIRVNAKDTDYFAGFAVTSAGQAVIQSAKANVGSIPLLINPNGGKVGIGTNNPQNALSVASGDFAVMRIHRSSNAATVGAAIALSSDYGEFGVMGWNQPNEFKLQDGEGNKFFYGGKDGLVLNTAATVKGDLHVTGNIIVDGEVSAGGAGTESEEGGTTGGGDALIYSQEFTPSTTSVSIAHNLSSTKGVIVQVWEKDTIAGTWNMVLVDIEEVDSNNIKLNFGRTETTLHKVVVMG